MTAETEEEKANSIATRASKIAKDAWAKARQEEYFEDAVRVYDQEMLSALYLMIEQQPKDLEEKS